MKLSHILLIILTVGICGCHSPEHTNAVGSESPDPLVDAIQKRDQTRTLELIKEGHPIEGTADQKNEPAYWAIATNNQDALETLIECGLDVDFEWGIGRGNLLTNAVQLGHMEIVRLLVGSGASPMRDSTYGRSPLYSSIIYDHSEIEHYLRSKGAKLNDQDMKALDQLGINKE